MKDIHEVLRQKEAQLEQLQKEVDALRIAARLLAEDEPKPVPAVSPISAVLSAAPVSHTARLKDNGHAAAWDATTKQFP